MPLFSPPSGGGVTQAALNALSGTCAATDIFLAASVPAAGNFVTSSLFDTVLTPSVINGTRDNWNPGPLGNITLVKFTTDATRNVNGLVSGSEGRIVCLMNMNISGSGNTAAFNHEQTTSTNVNRFRCAGGLGRTGGALGVVWFRYDSTIERWTNITDTQ